MLNVAFIKNPPQISDYTQQKYLILLYRKLNSSLSDTTVGVFEGIAGNPLRGVTVEKCERIVSILERHRGEAPLDKIVHERSECLSC